MAEPQRRLAPRDSDEDLNGKMGFLEHLDELRTRLIRCCVAIGAGMLAAFTIVGRIADFVLAPTVRMLPPGSSLVITRPGEGLSFYMDLALIGGVILAAPYVTYQVWCFIAPGLYARERRLILPFIAMTTVGTFGGALFTHYVLFPSMMAFFGTFDSPHMRFMPRVEDTFELYKNMLIAMVIVSQIPTVVFFLARMGLVTAQFLWRRVKYAVLASFIVAAVLTPSPDPWNQAAFTAPMMGLYFVSIAVAWIVSPSRRGRSTDSDITPGLKLVFAATMIEVVGRHDKSEREFPRLA